LAGVVGLVALVCSLTALQRVGVLSLASAAASPRGVADGRIWLLVTSGAIAADPLLWSLLSFVGLAFITLALCGWQVLWLTALAGQTFSTLFAYSLLGAARLLDPGAFQRLISAPDYGVSASQTHQARQRGVIGSRHGGRARVIGPAHRSSVRG
jgi:hypothetical protein